MFDELSKYRHQGNFFYQSTDSLTEVCNAPADQYGVFLVYALQKGKVELIYVGRSGYVAAKNEVDQPGNILLINGLKAQLINGSSEEDAAHQNTWPINMMIENIEALHIHWYVTIDEVHHDTPQYMRGTLLQKYQSIYGALPRWNRLIESTF